MYRWSGAYGTPGSNGPNGRTTKVNGNKGIMRAVRVRKRNEAEARNAVTPPERRRKNRHGVVCRSN